MDANRGNLVRRRLVWGFSVFVFVCLLLAGGVLRMRGARVTVPEVAESKAEGQEVDANGEGGQEAAETKEKVERPDHNHPAFGERKEERARMVERQIRARGVRDANVLAAMRTVPRHGFVRASDSRRAYADHPLPIGEGQTISQPYIVAYMTEALQLEPNDRVLEVGTGSGYQAAVCAEIAKEVYTIEIVEELAKQAKERLKKLGYGNVVVKAGDGYVGWEKKAPFDAVIITAAAGVIPQPLIEQLKPKGRLIMPLGRPFGYQELVLITKQDDGKVVRKRLLPVRFVPMTGEVMEEAEK